MKVKVALKVNLIWNENKIFSKLKNLKPMTPFYFPTTPVYELSLSSTIWPLTTPWNILLHLILYKYQWKVLSLNGKHTEIYNKS